MNQLKLGLLATAFAGAFAAQTAVADTLKYLGPAHGGYVSTSGLTDPVPGAPTPITTSPGAGGFVMSNLTHPGPSFVAWCVDIYGWLNTSSGGTQYNLMSGNAFYPGMVGAVRVAALETLASGVLAGVDTKAESGAFQLAVWEIVNETNLGVGFSLDTGTLRLTSASDGAKALANTWLTNLNNGVYTDSMTLNIWKDVNNNTQDLAVFAPVPEPETYAMMLAGLGLMGFVARRRKSRAA